MKITLLACLLFSAVGAMAMNFTEIFDIINEAKTAMPELSPIMKAISDETSELHQVGDDLELFKAIIETLGDINAIDPAILMSPLMFACQNCKPHIVRMLLAIGVNTQITNQLGSTALDVVNSMIDTLSISLILDSDADTDDSIAMKAAMQAELDAMQGDIDPIIEGMQISQNQQLEKYKEIRTLLKNAQSKEVSVDQASPSYSN